MRLVIIHFYSLFKHGSGSATAAVAACSGYEAALFPRVLEAAQTQNRLLLDSMWFIRHTFTKNSCEERVIMQYLATLSREFWGILPHYWSSSLRTQSLGVQYAHYGWSCSIVLHLSWLMGCSYYAQLDSIGYSTLTALCVRRAKTTTGCDAGLHGSIPKLIYTCEIHKLQSSGRFIE